MAGTDLTVAMAREILAYNPETGLFVWKIKPRPSSRLGDTAGHVSKFSGYVCIGYQGRHYYAHRLAWLHVNGCLPSGMIDHINGDKSDNRIANLRDVSRSVNGQNQRGPKADNKSGFLGVIWNRQRSKWQATIKVGRINKVIGMFETPEAAHDAYIQAKRRLHDGCTI